MKFILGLVVGIAGAWLYRARGQQNPSSMSELVQQARESVTTVATAGAQRAAEVIDKAPLPLQVKDVASRVVRTGPRDRHRAGWIWHTAERRSGEAGCRVRGRTRSDAGRRRRTGPRHTLSRTRPVARNLWGYGHTGRGDGATTRGGNDGREPGRGNRAPTASAMETLAHVAELVPFWAHRARQVAEGTLFIAEALLH
jgi:hypothetical protein